MPFRELLEDYPLYRKYPKCPWVFLNLVEKPSIHMACPTCKSDQTFIMSNEYYEGYPNINTALRGLSVRAIYLCVGCKQFSRYFLIRFAEDGQSVMKVGQEPPWAIAVDKNLERMLGGHVGTYRKGLICESQGYGIGAFSYYRRIVEEIIDELLDEIAQLIPPNERDRYSAALVTAKATRVAQDKIGLVKHLLPDSLKPEGLNPLSVLHDSLSQGLHGQSDERCVELAATTREVLVFLVREVLDHKAAAKSFSESIRKLLDKRS